MEWWHGNWIAGMYKSICDSLCREAFSIGDVKSMEKQLCMVVEDIEKLRKEVRDAVYAVRKAEWSYFITTLPSIEPAGDVIMTPDGKEWKWDSKGAIFGIPFDIYCSEGDSLYLFASDDDDRYYIESEFAEPDLVTREQMGYGKGTEYRKTDDGVIVTGAGTVNISKMFRENERFVDMEPYMNPIIDRSHDNGPELA